MRYDHGYVEINHKGKKVSTNVGTDFDDVVEKADDTVYRKSFLQNVHEARPDNISDVFYDSPDNWWFFLHINNMPDPFQDLTTGTIIKLPNE